jgi:hypothetical protein
MQEQDARGGYCWEVGVQEGSCGTDKAVGAE